MLNLELIPPVQIAVEPASTSPQLANFTDAEVVLYSRGQIRSVIPQETPTDAHSRRYKVPQIPLSEDDGVAVELAAVDGVGGRQSPLTSWNIARDVGTLKVRTYQDRTRGIRRARQPALGTPQKQIVTDQEIMRPLFTL